MCQLTTLQTGADRAWQTHLIKQGGQQKKPKQNPDEQKARVSHHNKWSANRQLCKWARPAALLLQPAVNWKIFCARHGCTWITLCCTMLYNRALSALCCCAETHTLPQLLHSSRRSHFNAISFQFAARSNAIKRFSQDQIWETNYNKYLILIYFFFLLFFTCIDL